MATLDRVATVATYTGTVDLSANNGLGAGAEGGGRRDGPRHRHAACSTCTTGGFDTHSAQNPNATNGTLLQPDGAR